MISAKQCFKLCENIFSRSISKTHNFIFKNQPQRMKVLCLVLAALFLPTLTLAHLRHRGGERALDPEDSDVAAKRSKTKCDLKNLGKMTFAQDVTYFKSTGVDMSKPKYGDLLTIDKAPFDSVDDTQKGFMSGFCVFINPTDFLLFCELRASFQDGPFNGSTVTTSGLLPVAGGTASFTLTGGTGCFAGVSGIALGQVPVIPAQTVPFNILLEDF